MKIVRRVGVFETNSSSTHSLTMTTRIEHDEWKKGNYVYDSYDDMLVPIDELSEEDKAEIDSDGQYYTYEGYCDYYASNYDTFDQTYVTKNGEEVIAFGYYGYN